MATLANIERYRYEEFPWHKADSLKTALNFIEKNQYVYALHFPTDKPSLKGEDVEKLIETYSPRTLQALLLPRCEMTLDNSKVFREYLRHDRKLKYLYLENSGLTDEMLQDLLEAFGTREEGKNQTLRTLMIGHNNITNLGAEYLKEFLKRNNSLFELSFGQNLDDTGVLEVCKGLAYNNSIRSLYLLDNLGSLAAGQALAYVASTHTTCNIVEFTSDQVDQSKFNKLVTQLASQEANLAFEEALEKDEKGKWLRSKIMIVGEGRAGKTATVRSLLGLDFDENLESTIGAEVKQSQSYSGNNRWHEDVTDATKFDFTSDTASRLAALKLQKERREFAGKIDGKNLGGFLQQLKDRQNEMESKIHERDRVRNNAKKDVEKGGENREFNAKMVMNKSSRGEDIMFTMFDFGGQEVFQSMHHLFLTNYGLYLLCFNMEKIIISPAEVYALEKIDYEKEHRGRFNHKEFEKVFRKRYKELVTEKRRIAKEYLLFWLNSIKIHAPGAPIILVGTHFDIVRHTDDLDIIDDFLKHILLDEEENLKFNVVMNRTGYFVPLDNKHRDKPLSDGEVSSERYKRAIGVNIEILRDMMEDIARKEPYVQQEIPLRWVRTLDTLLGQESDVVSYTEGYKLAHDIKIKDPVEFDKLLEWFHELGMIIHLTATASLRSMITTKPQWLLTAMSNVIRDKELHRYPEEEIKKVGLQAEYELMNTSGIVSLDLLNFFWKDLTPNNDATKERINYLVDLMRRTLLLSEYNYAIPELKSVRETDYVVKAYLVPSLLDKIDLEGLEFSQSQLHYLEVSDDYEVSMYVPGELDYNKLTAPQREEITGVLGLEQKQLLRRARLPGEAFMHAWGRAGNHFKKDMKKDEKLTPEQKEERAALLQKREEFRLHGFEPAHPEFGYGMVFDFSKSFLPNGIFQRFLCLAMLKGYDGGGGKRPVLHKNSAIVFMADGQVLRLYKKKHRILCMVNNEFERANRYLTSFMLKLKADTMGEELEYDTWYEYVSKKEGEAHRYMLLNQARKEKLVPWFAKDELPELKEVKHVDLDDFLAEF
eukprot:snap_masked-scaffold_4-processed-gene-6.22-mRNA-1 protein AED:0.45 eAED:0.47 QI:0/-1/0/1/-1/1/1/0/1048